MKFRTKIWMLPLSAALVFIIGMIVSFAVGSRTSASLRNLQAVDDPVLEGVQLVDRGVEEFRLTLQSAVAEGDVDKLRDVQAVADKVRKVLVNVAAIEGSAVAVKDLRSSFDAYQAAALAATRAMLGKSDAGDSVARMQSAQVALGKLMKTEMARAEKASADRQAEAAQGVSTALWINFATGATVLVVLGLVSRLVIGSVWRDLGNEPTQLLSITRHIAEGRLDVVPHVEAKDSGSLNAGLAEMMLKLQDTIGTIRLATESITTASNEIAVGNQDLSSRTETAASNLQATASSVETLTDSVRQSADSARQANQLAEAAAGSATRGGGIVTRVVENMEEINASSRKIAEIIGVIDGIAFQTNILALNAAVEAARAGDQGRGFAVVASEVRGLAQRSAQAAREIKTLIVASTEKVESGAKLVNDAGAAMHEIVSGVRRVTDIIGEISAAATEQSGSIDQVNSAVTELDRMTQQNAALVEQSAAAATSMHDQAGRLSQAVAAFRLAH